MKRRSSDLTFTLFPFLAVLMCTMGALILILLVTTRKIRQNAVAAAIAQQEAVISDPPPAWEPVARLAPVPVLPWGTLRPVPSPEPEPPQLPVGPSPAEQARLAYEQQRHARTQEQAELDAHYSRQQRALQQQLAAAQARVSTLQKSVETASASLQSVSQQGQKLAAARSQMLASEQNLASATQQQQTSLEQTQIALNGLQTSLALARAKARDQRPQLSVVAHDPQAGTTRRPILIEAHGDRLVFPSEQITLSTRELDGFNPDINPVRAVTETLLKHWTEVDAAAGKSQAEPYVLVLVRPQGVVGFLVICQMLQEVKTASGQELRFGYELVLADDEFLFPPSDPKAITACRQALESVFTRRPGNSPKVRTRSDAALDSLQFSANDGSFRMQEVDRLRNVDDPYAIANPWVTPHGDKAAPRGTGNRSAPGTTPEFLQGTPRSGGTPSGTGRGPIATGSGNDSETTMNAFLDRARTERSTTNSAQATPGAGQTASGSAPAGTRDIPGMPPMSTPTVPPVTGSQSASVPQGTSSPGTSGAPGMPALSPVESLPFLQAPTAQASSPVASEDGLPPTPWEAASNSGTELKEPEWLPGQRVPSKSIGIERDVVLDVWIDRLEVLESDLRLSVPENASKAQFQGLVSQILSLDVRTWGPAPAGFVWRPHLKVVIHPGGNLHARRVEELARSWGVKLRTEQALE